MKFKLILTLSILQFSTYLFAQEENLISGPKIKGLSTSDHVRINNNTLSCLGWNYINGSYNAQNISLPKLTAEGMPTTVLAKGKELGNFQGNSKEFSIQQIIELKDKAVAFYLKTEKKDKTNSLYYQFLDTEYKPTSKILKIARRNSTKFAIKWGFGDGGGFEVKTNKTKDQILIINEEATTEVDGKDKIGEVTFSLFDVKDMSEISSGKYDLGIGNIKNNLKFGNNGFVYSAVRVIINKDEPRKQRKKNREIKTSYYYKVIGINLKEPEAKLVETELIFDDKEIITASIDVNEDGELFCFGMYDLIKDEKVEKNFEGVYFAKLDNKTLEVLTSNQIKLDEETSDFLKLKRKLSKDDIKNGLSSEIVKPRFIFKDFVKYKNGESNIILEFEEKTVWEGTDSKGRRYTTVSYQTGSILVINLSINYDVNWMKCIPKNQYTSNNLTKSDHSYLLKSDGNSLNFIFFDTPKNYDKKTQVSIMNEKSKGADFYFCDSDRNLAMARIDEKGIVTQKLICEIPKKYSINWKNGVWSENGRVYYFAGNKQYSDIITGLYCLLFPWWIIDMINHTEEKVEFNRFFKLSLN